MSVLSLNIEAKAVSYSGTRADNARQVTFHLKPGGNRKCQLSAEPDLQDVRFAMTDTEDPNWNKISEMLY